MPVDLSVHYSSGTSFDAQKNPDPPELDAIAMALKIVQKFTPLRPPPYKDRAYALFPTEWPVLEECIRVREDQFPRKLENTVSSSMKRFKIELILSPSKYTTIFAVPPTVAAVRYFADRVRDAEINIEYQIQPHDSEVVNTGSVYSRIRTRIEHKKKVKKFSKGEPRNFTLPPRVLINGSFWRRRDITCTPELFFCIRYVLKEFRDVAERQDSLHYILNHPSRFQIDDYDHCTLPQFQSFVVVSLQCLYCNFRRMAT